MHANTQRTGIFNGAYRHLPHQFTALQIHGGHGTERRFLARNTQRRQEALTHCAERRPFHRHNPHLNAAGIFGDFFTRNHIVRQTQAHIVDEHQAVVRIHRDAAPVHAAQRTRILQRTVFARRCEDALMTHGFKGDSTDQQVHRRGAPHIRLFQGVIANHRHAHGVGLCRRITFAFNRPGGHRALFHFRHRFPGRAVEHKDHPLLAGLHQHRRGAAFPVGEVVQQRL